MTGPFGTRLFRIVLALAGCYNLAFGLWAAVWPWQFFKLFNVAPPRYPGIWACLGMVLGLYGLLYFYAAWYPERGQPIVAIGLLGKILGPLGMLMMFDETWPRRLGMICVYNDLIWWLPFALFLLRGTDVARRLSPLAPWFCAALHAAGVAALLLLLRHGLPGHSTAVQRAGYIADHPVAWAAGWTVWMLAALSLASFYAWWASQLAKCHWATASVLVAALGVVCDLSGESLSVLVLHERALAALEHSAAGSRALAAFEQIERVATLLTAGAANALYTVAGWILMILTADLPRGVRLAMWGTWLSGIGMSLATIFHHVYGIMATTAVLFPLLIAWTVWMGWRWRRA